MNQPDSSHRTDAYQPAPTRERFAPGSLLAGRYRVIACLGKGGMGEVYRADDLTLGQPVALKFLPATVAADADRLARFRKEVAAARQVSHPNVCRVYDIAEADGQPFLTMEHIDGEDLAALLRRVGRLPEEKGVEVARQLCAALGAVHDQGLLHRDLKPANVMLDGRGRVRLTDFGLAVAEELSGAEVRSGTPLYQAPEQLAGKEVTVRSDLYALGLVLYELFTGRRAFAGKERDTPPSKPSSHVSGIGGEVEAVILQCLELNPAERPKSAAEVLAALPGGDALAAVLAAGETPSPRLVADAGEVGALSPAVGLALLGGTALLLVLLAVLNDWTTLFRRVPMTKTPAELTVRGRELLDTIAKPPVPADSASGFMPDVSYLWTARVSTRFPNWWDDIRIGQPAPLHFFYRQSPEPLLAADLTLSESLTLSPGNPQVTRPGMAGVRLDGTGRLLELYVVPPVRERTRVKPTEPNFDALFHAAGLSRGALQETTPELVPPFYTGPRRAWVGPYPDNPEVRVRVEAAAFRGRPSWFVVIADGVPREPEAPVVWIRNSSALVLLAVTAAALLLTVRNLRHGRGDWRGAVRLFGFCMVVLIAAWIIGGHHVANIAGEFRQFAARLGMAAIALILTAACYLAVEPALRRRWPGRMTAWARLLDGRLRDPLVGRDLLIGVLAGMALVVVEKLPWVIGQWLELSLMPVGRFIHRLQPPLALEILLGVPAYGMARALLAFATAFLLALVLRKPWLSWPAFIAVEMFLAVDLRGAPVSLVLHGGTMVLYFTIVAVLIARFGLLANVCCATISLLLPLLTLTYDASAWYFGQGLAWALAVLALAGYGYFTATRGGRLFGEGFFGDD